MVYSVVVLKFSIFWAISQSEPAAIPLLEGCLDMSKIVFSLKLKFYQILTLLRTWIRTREDFEFWFLCFHCFDVTPMDFNWRLLNIPKRGKSLLISSEHFSETRKMCLPVAGDQAQIYTVKPQIFLSQATSISTSSQKYLFVNPQTFLSQATNIYPLIRNISLLSYCTNICPHCKQLLSVKKLLP